MPKPVGTIFAELDLDVSKFSAAQKKILYDSQTMAINVEKSWSVLGQKSDVMYSAMRQQAVNAYENIKSRATSSAAEIIRAEEAKDAKLKALDEQQFGNQNSIIASFKANWVAASIAIVAAVGLIRKGFDLAEAGAQVKSIEESFKIITKSSGIAADALISNLKKATNETIDDSELMKKANRMMLEGFSSTQMTQIAEAARIAARVMGTDVKTAYDQVADSIVNLRERGLKTAGFVIDSTAAYEKHARTLGVGVGYLNEYGKQMALVEALEEKRLERLKQMGPLEESESETMQKQVAIWHSVYEEIAKAASALWNYDTAKRAAKMAGPEWDVSQYGMPAGGDTGSVAKYSGLEEHGVGAGRGPGASEASKKSQVDQRKYNEDLLKLQDEYAVKMAQLQDDSGAKRIQQLEAERKKALDEATKTGIGRLEIEKYYAQAIAKARSAFAFEQMEPLLKGIEERTALETDLVKLGNEQYEHDKEIEATTAQTAVNLAGMTGDVGKQEEAYSRLLRIQLDSHEVEYRRGVLKQKELIDLMNDVALEEKLNRERGRLVTSHGLVKEWADIYGNVELAKLAELDLANLESERLTKLGIEKDLVQKITEARRDEIMNREKWAKAEDIGNQMQQSMTTFLKDLPTQGADAFKKFGENMLDTFEKVLADMAAKWIMFGDIFGTSKSAVGSGTGVVGMLASLFSLREGGIMNASFMPFHAYAGGGVASGPTFGLFGEGGPEAFVPLRNGKIPVEGGKGGGGTMVYNDNRTTNYIDALDQKSIEDRVTGPVIRGMSRPKHKDAMRNIIRSRG